MRRNITKYKSNIDSFILSLLIVLISVNFCSWLNYQFRNLDGFLWLIIPLEFAFGVVTTFFICLLYWNLHSKEKKLESLQKKVYKHLYTHYKSMNESKVIKLIEDICNATNVPIEERKPLFDEVCKFYVDYYNAIPGYVILMWKKAVVEYKKYEIWMD